MSKLGFWNPVYDYGCGWDQCPECGPMIEIEIETKHRRMRDKTSPSADRLSEWSAEQHGTGADRVAPVISLDEKRAGRTARNRVRAETRVRRTLREDSKARALAWMKTAKPRRLYLSEGRHDWESEVWLEFTNPTQLVASRERKLTVEQKIERAANRAQAKMLRSIRKKPQTLLIGGGESDV